MGDTIISWTKKTWNPVHGCSRISEGCRYCYAESLSLKYGFTTQPWTAGNVEANLKLQRHKLREPYGYAPGTKCFVNSMSDLLLPAIPADYLAEIWAVMVCCPHVTFQVLTKRADRLADLGLPWAPNIWMGVTVENERSLDRVDALRACGAAVKFLSLEPLLGPLAALDLTGIDQVLVGGESGHHLRAGEDARRTGINPCFAEPRWLDMRWARDIRDKAVAAGCAYFFKQDSGLRTELRPWLVEADGRRFRWAQYPGELTPPVEVDERGEEVQSAPRAVQLALL